MDVVDGGGEGWRGGEGGDCSGGEEGDWLEEKGGGCWWEGEEGDLMEEEGGGDV